MNLSERKIVEAAKHIRLYLPTSTIIFVFRYLDTDDDEEMAHYIVFPKNLLLPMGLDRDDVLILANCTWPPTFPGQIHYTTSDTKTKAVPDVKPAGSAFQACGESCQIVQVNVRDQLELRYQQHHDGKKFRAPIVRSALTISDISVAHYYIRTTGVVSLGGPP